jgi:poly-gamma-glutamate capsule biosynthesis protein CapA/YwtB (metallophosphatase superfamily)
VRRRLRRQPRVAAEALVLTLAALTSAGLLGAALADDSSNQAELQTRLDRSKRDAAESGRELTEAEARITVGRARHGEDWRPPLGARRQARARAGAAAEALTRACAPRPVEALYPLRGSPR